MEIKDKVIVITGAAQGLGKNFALDLANRGAKLALADINQELLEEVRKTCEQAGTEARAYDLNVAEEKAVEDFFDQAVSDFGTVDVLINNAAIFTTLDMKPFYEIDPIEWRDVINVNLNGVYQCSRQVVDAMRRHGFGRIVNVGSAAVTMGRPNYTHYVASKSALVGMSRSMARELGSFGITVNTIMPGATFTEIERKTVTPQQKDAIVASQCIQRPATPDDIIGTVLFLCSREAGFITGQSVTIDGGATHS